jgi:hypothetical protein
LEITRETKEKRETTPQLSVFDRAFFNPVVVGLCLYRAESQETTTTGQNESPQKTTHKAKPSMLT